MDKTILGIKSSCNLYRKVIVTDHFRKIKSKVTKNEHASTALCREWSYWLNLMKFAMEYFFSLLSAYLHFLETLVIIKIQGQNIPSGKVPHVHLVTDAPPPLKITDAPLRHLYVNRARRHYVKMYLWVCISSLGNEERREVFVLFTDTGI